MVLLPVRDGLAYIKNTALAVVLLDQNAAVLSNGASGSGRCSNDPNVNQHLTLLQIAKRRVRPRMCFALSRCDSIFVSLYNLRLFDTPIQSANEMTSIS